MHVYTYPLSCYWCYVIYTHTHIHDEILSIDCQEELPSVPQKGIFQITKLAPFKNATLICLLT